MKLLFSATDMTDKKSLRAYYRKLRSSVSGRTAKDSAISRRILQFQQVRQADNILVYASFGSEVSTCEIISHLLADGKNVSLPICSGDGIMNFHIIHSLDDTKPGMYGIPEPPENNPCPDLEKNTVCIVPGLAFTPDGGRLGYGGGYYDRFLSAHPHIFTVAPVYEELIAQELPLLPHDMRADALATEERMVLCSAQQR